MDVDGLTVSDLGEERLVGRILERIGPPPADELWGGDDAAVVRPPGETLVWTTDMLVERVDFDLSYCSPRDVGWKALAVTISDVAAMGARPSHALVALSLPARCPARFVDGLLEGLLEASGRFRVGVAGGDVSGADEIVAVVSVIGAPVDGRVVARGGAQTGDAICVTGSVGGAGAGLALLRAGVSRSNAARALATRQLRPEPRVAAGIAIASSGASAMIDVSDGLAVDLARLLDASARGCDVDTNAIPIDPGIVELGDVAGASPLSWALLGGEDFELLFTIEPAALPSLKTAVERTGTSVSRIGTVTAAGRRVGDRELEEWREAGWEHLRNR